MQRPRRRPIPLPRRRCPMPLATVSRRSIPRPRRTVPQPTPAPAPAPMAGQDAGSAAQPQVSAPVAAAPAPTAGQAADGRFFVHLGVYGETRNAAELVAALKKGGFPAFAEASEYKGKPAQRVRVGPFEDRAAAEAARLRIKQLQPAVPGSVLQLAVDAKADAAPSALPADRAGGWAVQLGALKTVEDAHKLRDRVKAAGFAAFVDKVDANGTTLWRVRAGPEVERGAADKLRASIKDKLKLDGMIVTQQ